MNDAPKPTDLSPLIDVAVALTNRKDKTPYRVPWDVAEAIYDSLVRYDWPDSSEPERFPVAEYLIGLHIFTHSEFLWTWVAKAKSHMAGRSPGDTDAVCDDDVYIDCLLSSESKTVFHIRNVCSCADIVSWLVIWEVAESHETIHVRGLHERESKKSFPEKLSLNSYIRNGFTVRYGDFRDSGWVISLKKYTGALADMNRRPNTVQGVDKVHYYYNEWRHAMFNLHWLEQAWAEDKFKS